MKPLFDNIVVIPFEGEEKTSGGIILPETGIELPPEGEVVAVGPGRLLDDGTVVPMGVKPGDYIVWSKFVGSDIKIKDVKYVVLKERDVLLIIEKPVISA